MSDQKMKPGTLAGIAVWVTGILVLGFLYTMFFMDMDKYAIVAWRHNPVFRMRVIGFTVLSLALCFVGLNGMKKWLEGKLGTGTADLKKANLELQVKD